MKRKLCRLKLPVLWGKLLGIEIPFHSFRSFIFSPLFHGKLPTDVQISISSGYLVSEKINLFLYSKKNLLYISKQKQIQYSYIHTYTQKSPKLQKVTIAGKTVNSAGDIVNGSPVLILCLYFL